VRAFEVVLSPLVPESEPRARTTSTSRTPASGVPFPAARGQECGNDAGVLHRHFDYTRIVNLTVEVRNCRNRHFEAQRDASLAYSSVAICGSGNALH
jgi:hypothetical protein